MSNVFFISDLHLGHKRIIEFEGDARPFDTIEEHDQAIIDNCNQIVRTKDILWILGDIVFGKENLPKLGQINGRKRLIMGNHDHYPMEEYLKYFEKIYGCFQYKKMILTHIPVDKSKNQRRYTHNMHGHMHSGSMNDPWYINVCCEHIGLRPISLDEIRLAND